MKKIKRIMTGFLILCILIVFSSTQNKTISYASTDNTQSPTQPSDIVLSKDIDTINATPGTTLQLSIPVRAVGGTVYMNNPHIDIDTSNTPFDLSSRVVLTNENNGSTTYIGYATTYLNFNLDVKDSAKMGTYNVNINFTAVNNDGAVYTKKLATPIKIKVIQERAKPSLVIENLKTGSNLVPGNTFNLTFTARNIGGLPARSAYIKIDGYTADGVLPSYTEEKVVLGDVGSGESKTVTLPVYVSSAATNGVKTLTIKANFNDSDGKAYDPETTNVYIPVTVKSTGDAADLLISKVKQSPAIPKAGQKVKVSFQVQNKSDADLYEIKVTPTNLTSANFSPLKGEPYKFIGTMKKGETKTVTMNFKVSKQVVEGLNEVDVQFSYKDKNGKIFTVANASKLYVLNITNPQKESVGVPKLIISDFKTNTEALKAGKTFVFTFDIFNTHSTLSANNIKVTLSSEDNVFSVTSGSNSFYIKTIKPGQTIHKKIELRVKPDCVTKAYPLKVDFEYEYEGMQKLENQISTGLTISQVLNLSVMENSRPTVSNIIVGTWEPPTANTATNMSFDFYNMGKSVLNNVTARVESKDFTPTQQTVFIGNVAAGTGATHEMELTPNISDATGKGKLIITYEDSNGNSIEVPTDFEAYVAPAAAPAADMGANVPTAPVTKKEIVKLPVFIGLQIILFAFGIIVVRKIIISSYKSKLRDKEE